MNDPGLDDPISKVADLIEEDKDEEREAENEDEQTFLNPRCVLISAYSELHAC